MNPLKKTRLLFFSCLLWILSIILWILFYLPAKTYAYTPTAQDTNLTWAVINKLFVYFKDKNWPQKEMKIVQNRLHELEKTYQVSQPKYAHIFGMAHTYLSSFHQKQQETWYTDNAEAFLKKYSSTMLLDWATEANLQPCFNQYPLVDHTARAMGIPPMFVLATWYIESTCRMYNPTNGDGIFQIINNHYIPGDIDIATLADELIDFETFIKRKFDWYNTTQNPVINYGYNSYNINTLQTFAALYNGLSGPLSAYPLWLWNPYYFFGNYSPEYDAKKDGRLVLFMKLLRMENQMINRGK